MLTFMCLCVTFHLSLSQFQDHIDLQKVSEITFKNEKYNVLKPTIHVIRDHFKDFIQKRKNNDFPTKRVFIDKDGFRHYWKGMDFKKLNNLRKADFSESILKNDKDKTTILTKNSILDKHENGTNIDLSKITVKVKDKPKRKKRILQDVLVPAKSNLRTGSVIIKTTFFCPFFGVIRMSTNVDNFEEDKSNTTKS